MELPETFEAVRTSIIAFISRIVVTEPGAPVPAFPQIFGTGFLVDKSGIAATNRHVIDFIEQLNNQYPRNPRTGDAPIGALLFTDVTADDSGQMMGMLNVDILGWNTLAEFSSSTPWFGQPVPDLGFVQLNVRNTPYLDLDTAAHTLRVGMSVATAGFPEGDLTVRYHGHITQLTPVLRHGIVSSVFPFRGAYPHGFSIDTLLQGGASGSPVFVAETGKVVGMIASQITGTNYTVAVPSHILAGALTSIKGNWPDFSNVPTLAQLIESGEAAGEVSSLSWDQFQINLPSEGTG